MIARVWSAKATEAASKDYLDHYNNSVVPELRKIEGYTGSTVLTRVTAGQVEIIVATLWGSLQAIQQFAGPDLEQAVVAAEAARILTDYDHRVQHFEVALIDIPASVPLI